MGTLQRLIFRSPCPVSPTTYFSARNGATLAGGFSSDGLREWAIITDFGALNDNEMTERDVRMRRRELLSDDDPGKQLYVDLFSTRVSEKCCKYISGQPSPSDVLGRAFFGSSNFMGERLVLSTLNSMFSLYPRDATTLPEEFKFNHQYLQWRVAMKSPLELICSYEIESLGFKGCTMLALDPTLRKVYHGNCISIPEERLEGFLAKIGVKGHEAYARFLLDGMSNELEHIAKTK